MDEGTNQSPNQGSSNTAIVAIVVLVIIVVGVLFFFNGYSHKAEEKTATPSIDASTKVEAPKADAPKTEKEKP